MESSYDKKIVRNGITITMNVDESLIKLYDKGAALYNDRRYNEAHLIFVECAEKGYAKGYNAVALDYRDGEGVQQDCEKAIEFFKIAADAGCAMAAGNLADMLYFNTDYGIPEDNDSLFHFAKMGAEAGDLKSIGALAICYFNGMGCEENNKLSFYWAMKAHKGGCDYASNTLGHFFFYGLYMPKCIAYARYFWEKVTEYYNVDVEIFLPTIDTDEKKELYKEDIAEYRRIHAVEPHIPPLDDTQPGFFDDPDPCNWYYKGLDYVYARGCEPDAEKAEKYLTMAAESGHVDAMETLGLFLANYWDNPCARYKEKWSDELGTVYRSKVISFAWNPAKAVLYLEKAAEYGSVSAINTLAEIYIKGETDYQPGFEKAKKYYEMKYELEQDKKDKSILDRFDNYFTAHVLEDIRSEVKDILLNLVREAVDKSDYDSASKYSKLAHMQFVSDDTMKYVKKDSLLKHSLSGVFRADSTSIPDLVKAAKDGDVDAVKILADVYVSGDIDCIPSYEKAKKYRTMRYELTGDERDRKILNEFDEYFSNNVMLDVRSEVEKILLDLGEKAIHDYDDSDAWYYCKLAHSQYLSGKAAILMSNLEHRKRHDTECFRWMSYGSYIDEKHKAIRDKWNRITE